MKTGKIAKHLSTATCDTAQKYRTATFFTNCTAISVDKKQIIRQIVGDAVQGTPQSANEANPRHPEATLPLQPPPTHQNLNSGASYA